jgi:CDP-glucose 4,6-dehydratase
MFADTFRSKTVWISGSTGFKGAWLAQWLVELGATVHGYSLASPTTPSVSTRIRIGERIRQQTADIVDAAAVRESIVSARPDFVFHLAAQPLVRAAFDDPAGTYAANVMGTVNVLEALRHLPADKPCAAVFVTTDKCYENREWLHGYREEDPLGGHDPYSSSKACAEIAVGSWRRSFFGSGPVRIASARAGNVIGGGDWAKDRIVPDSIRALRDGEAIPVRNRVSSRPWQHVLEPLSGYLWLAALLARPELRRVDPRLISGAFNFGPNLDSNRTVAELVEEVLRHWPGRWEDRSDPAAVHEARLLNLACDKAHHLLGWRPVWDFAATVQATVSWYRREQEDPADLLRMTTEQIGRYAAEAARAGVAWAR